jgi:hypothetical protein
MLARLVRNINPYPLGAGVTALSPGVRLVVNRQNAGADCSQSDERRQVLSQTGRPCQAGGYAERK